MSMLDVRVRVMRLLYVAVLYEADDRYSLDLRYNPCFVWLDMKGVCWLCWSSRRGDGW